MPSQGGIPPTTPARLTPDVRCVPPILYKHATASMAGYSQAPRGLSVPSSVPCIFTGPAISPGRSLRQCPSRYAFRAGRNLPDQEFRYLRTVIVTAAVDWGFASPLARLRFTFQHWAGVSPYTSSCDFAETCVCGKQSLGPFSCPPAGRSRRGPLLPKLRGQFAEFLNERSPARLRLVASPTSGGLSTDGGDLPERLFWAAELAGLSRGFPRVPVRVSPRGFPPGAYPRSTGMSNSPRRSPPASSSVRQSPPVSESPPIVHRLRPRASP